MIGEISLTKSRRRLQPSPEKIQVSSKRLITRRKIDWNKSCLELDRQTWRFKISINYLPGSLQMKIGKKLLMILVVAAAMVTHHANASLLGESVMASSFGPPLSTSAAVIGASGAEFSQQLFVTIDGASIPQTFNYDFSDTGLFIEYSSPYQGATGVTTGPINKVFFTFTSPDFLGITGISLSQNFMIGTPIVEAASFTANAISLAINDTSGIVSGASAFITIFTKEPISSVPEPLTLALLAGGFLALAAAQRRRQNPDA